MPMHTQIATIGISAPNGVTNVAGFTDPANACARSRSVAAADLVYINKLASALTTAIVAKDSDSASVSATADVKTIAFTGVCDAECTRPNHRGSWPCSARAKSIRDPFSTCPALLPDIDTTDPT